MALTATVLVKSDKNQDVEYFDSPAEFYASGSQQSPSVARSRPC